MTTIGSLVDNLVLPDKVQGNYAAEIRHQRALAKAAKAQAELEREAHRVKLTPMRSFTVKRNGPCPCGSQKKYKQCCVALVNLPVAGVIRPGTPTPEKD